MILVYGGVECMCIKYLYSMIHVVIDIVVVIVVVIEFIKLSSLFLGFSLFA